MRYIKNAWYRIVEFYSRLTGDTVSADYYAAKRGGHK